MKKANIYERSAPEFLRIEAFVFKSLKGIYDAFFIFLICHAVPAVV